MFFRLLTCAVALIAIPALSVLSQDSSMSDSGIYFNVGGGLSLFSEIEKAKVGIWFEKDGEAFYLDENLARKDGTPTLTEVDYDVSFDMGWSVGGAVGYRFGAVRVEAEGSYFSANLNKHAGRDIDQDKFETQPSMSVLALMANGWYDVDTGTIFSPFIGIGVGGLQGTSSQGVEKNAPDDFETVEHSGWGFAYQAGAGGAVEVTDGLSIRLGYRLFGTLETTYTAKLEATGPAGADTIADTIVQGLAFPLLVHRVELGLSYQF